MRFANLRELKINSNAVLKRLAREDIVLTNRGKPVAAIVYMDEELLDAYIIAHHPTLLRDIEKDIRSWKRGRLRTHTLEEVRARVLGSGRRGEKRTG